MRKIVFLMIAAFACHDAHAQLDLHLGVSGSRSYSCLADLTDSGIGFGGGLEVAADLNDRFQFIGSLALDRHGADATSLPVMAGLRVSTTSDDDMFCFVQQLLKGKSIPGRIESTIVRILKTKRYKHCQDTEKTRYRLRVFSLYGTERSSRLPRPMLLLRANGMAVLYTTPDITR